MTTTRSDHPVDRLGVQSFDDVGPPGDAEGGSGPLERLHGVEVGLTPDEDERGHPLERPDVAGSWRRERRPGRSLDDPVGGEAVLALEASYRLGRPRAVDAVDVTRVEDGVRERSLRLHDVFAARRAVKRPPQRPFAELLARGLFAEQPPRRGPDDAVLREPAVGLELAHGPGRSVAVDPVDDPGVEAFLGQGALEHAHVLARYGAVQGTQLSNLSHGRSCRCYTRGPFQVKTLPQANAGRFLPPAGAARL